MEDSSPRFVRALTQRFGTALRHRNYRLFFAGQSISLIGTWLTRFATQWMVYRLTKSPMMLGLVAFFGQAPAAVLAPLAGVLVDRWDRRRTVVATQVAAMLQSAALAFFALTGWMTVWHLLVLGAVQAVIQAFDTVSRQSFLGAMIEDRADLPNAVALNSMMVNVARMIGPVCAAVLVGLLGEGWCFALDAASYLAVIGSLLAMQGIPRAIPPRAGHVAHEMKEGLSYVGRLPIVRAVLLLFAATSVLAGSYSTMLPLIAGETLHGGPHTLGTLMGAAGLGALTGAILLANRTSAEARRGIIGTDAAHVARMGVLRLLATCSIGLGVGLSLMELARSTFAAVPILFIIGGCLIMQAALTMTFVQTSIDQGMLGRVMSLVAVVFFGGAPTGALLSGALAKRVGPIHTFAIAGIACLACGIAFARALPRLREHSAASGATASPVEAG